MNEPRMILNGVDETARIHQLAAMEQTELALQREDALALKASLVVYVEELAAGKISVKSGNPYRGAGGRFSKKTGGGKGKGKAPIPADQLPLPADATQDQLDQWDAAANKAIQDDNDKQSAAIAKMKDGPAKDAASAKLEADQEARSAKMLATYRARYSQLHPDGKPATALPGYLPNGQLDPNYKPAPSTPSPSTPSPSGPSPSTSNPTTTGPKKKTVSGGQTADEVNAYYNKQMQDLMNKQLKDPVIQVKGHKWQSKQFKQKAAERKNVYNLMRTNLEADRKKDLDLVK